MKGVLQEATDGTCGWNKDPDKQNYGSGMMLVIFSMRNVNYGKNGNRETQTRKSG